MASLAITAGLAALISLPPVPPPPSGDAGFPIVTVQQQQRGNRDADCSAAAAQAVGETGGQLLSARPSGGTCVVTVLIPARDNERPRKVTVRVPL